MKKVLVTILFSFLSSISFAQSKSEILKEINGISNYNATILGYAINCSFSKEDVELVKKQFLIVLTSLNLTQEDYDYIYKNFFDTLKITKEKGPKNSNMTCSEFKTEFDKITQAIKSGRG